MASPVNTSVKFFNETMPGAPVLNGVAGSLVALLDACLITGFGVRSCTITVAGGVATALVASDAKNLNTLDSVLLVAGASGSWVALNGEQKVTAATAVSISWATALPDGTATGTITIKQAPAGSWDKPYSTTSIAVFRSLDPASFGACLWVNDTGTTSAQVRMYETMSAHSTGTNMSPTTTDAASVHWNKAVSTSATGVAWDFFANSRCMLFCPIANFAVSPTTVAQPTLFFGDIQPYKSIDPFAVLLTAATNTNVAGGSVLIGQQGSNSTSRLLRAYTGLGVSVPAFALPVSGATGGVSGADTYWGAFPTVDGKLLLSRVMVTEGTAVNSAATIRRGLVPGAWYVPHSNAGPAFPRGTRLAQDGRNFYSIRQASSQLNEAMTSSGLGFVDITGPW